jgi:SAM-dependent methyltransferase
MKRTLREFLRRRLSPQSYQQVRRWWRCRLYWPSLAASYLVQGRPLVRGFPAGRASDLVHELRAVNVLAPTEMCRVMNRHGSDKGVGGPHNYTPIYSVLFGKLRGQQFRIFELGLGSNHAGFAANMGRDGVPGASLRGWKEFFPQAQVYGADIDRSILFEEERVMTFYCDQLDSDAIKQLWAQPALEGGMDVIIEDGMHTFEGSLSFLDGSIEQLRPGGIYIIEDIAKDTLGRWRDVLETTYPRRFPNHDFALVELPHSFKRHHNNLLIIRRSR